MNSAVTVTILPNLPDDARALIWSEFYQSRARGRSLAVHSPWIDHDAGLWCVTARSGENGQLAGTLVVKTLMQGGDQRQGLIGYVCVASEQRGRGIGRLMLDKTVKNARDAGYGALLLWTGAPDIYRSSGFVALETDIFRCYPALRSAVPAARSWREEDWPTADEAHRGLPAFSRRARFVETGLARAILLDTECGPAVAEWEGADVDVLTLISTVCEKDWWLNALRGDSILLELERRGMIPREDHRSRMMALALDGQALDTIVGVRTLDRI